jgi:hypothetical protein
MCFMPLQPETITAAPTSAKIVFNALPSKKSDRSSLATYYIE